MLAPLVAIAAIMIAMLALVARYPPRPGPHYALGYPPGTVCTYVGRRAAEVCEHDPNYRPPSPPPAKPAAR
jgi:hypothetical protein